ncbi:MAG: mechanosensitive ion channel family protein [Anaerolineae bacterium]
MNLENLSDVTGTINTQSIIQAILLVMGAVLINVLIYRVLTWVSERVSGRIRPYLLATIPATRLILIVGTIILIIPIFIEPTFNNLITILGAVGLALGFAFKDYASSLIAGVVTLYEMPYRQGDWVEIEDIYGEVRDISLRYYKLVTPDDTAVIVPHIKIWNSLVKNSNDGSPNLMCVTHFYIAQEHDSQFVYHLLKDVTLSSPYLFVKNGVTVIVKEEAYATHYHVKAYPLDVREQFQFMTDITLKGQEALARHGIQSERNAVAFDANGL